MHTSGVEQQRIAFEEKYSASEVARWAFHDSKDKLTRFLRDRRMKRGLDYLMSITRSTPVEWNALVVCGGVGGEGTMLANAGFASVTVSDFSEHALNICHVRDARLKTIVLDAERLELPDESYDLVIVQDGLHHLPRPVLGYSEMLRVAKRAVIVIEPHLGFVSALLGTTWERHGDSVNYVFRWNGALLEQATRSYVLERPCHVKAIRIWDHNVVVGRWANRLGRRKFGLLVARGIYATLDLLLPRLGNQMIGVVVKDTAN